MRTTLGANILEQLKRGTLQKQDLLRELEAGAGKAEGMRVGPPVVTVHVYQLRGVGPVKIAAGTMGASLDSYDLWKSVPLYAMADPNQIDVVRIGRLPEQDVSIPDLQISREHLLVILAGRGAMLCDYGTLKGGERRGSTNGTVIVDVGQIRDTLLDWLPLWTLEIGTQYKRGARQLGAIRIKYEPHPIVAN